MRWTFWCRMVSGCLRSMRSSPILHSRLCRRGRREQSRFWLRPNDFVGHHERLQRHLLHRAPDDRGDKHDEAGQGDGRAPRLRLAPGRRDGGRAAADQPRRRPGQQDGVGDDLHGALLPPPGRPLGGDLRSRGRRHRRHPVLRPRHLRAEEPGAGAAGAVEPVVVPQVRCGRRGLLRRRLQRGAGGDVLAEGRRHPPGD